MNTYQIYVGTTKVKKLKRLLQAILFEGYTMVHGNGYWQGKDLPTEIVTATMSESVLKHLLDRILEELPQESVAYHKVADMEFAQ